MSCLLTMCLGKFCVPKFSLLESDEPDDSPSIFANIKDDLAFKVKIAKKSYNLKGELAEREKARKKRIKELKTPNKCTV
jgi:hypothetical protein